jgi:hypothetical protein
VIEIIHPPKPRVRHEVHPEWQHWIDESAYTLPVARKELGLPRNTFYRRIAKAPTLLDKLAMRTLYEGLEPFE